MESHLIIGLGGTGGRVLSAFRKIVHEKLHGEMSPEWLWLDYVYVDSSEQDLKMENPELWSVMGQSIRLDENSLVRIPASNLAEFIENKSRYKYLEPWIGDEKKWENIIRDPKISAGAAGQKRRLGRLLFANGAPRFKETVGNKISHLKTNPQGQKVNFHVVAGLAGGTGSGSIVDAVAQIRKEYPDVDNFRIYLYLLLPEDGKTSWATTDNYRPNGYAALTELNAMEMNAFGPWDVGERNYEVKRLKQELPFYSAYLVTDENTQNVSFDVEKTIPQSIAEFLFQKTVGLALNERNSQDGNGQTQDIAEFFDRAERGENPKYSEYDQLQSYNFMTYGIKRFAIPEIEIKEYFGYNFAAQAINQMLYNNLTKEKGYVGEPKNITEDDYSYVINKENRRKWHLTREYLCLSQPILPEHKKEGWQSLNDEFSIVIKKIRSKVIGEKSIKHNDKFTAIFNLSRKFYDKDFRPVREEGQNGVVNFYNDKLKYGKQAMAEFIVEGIGSEFFQSWINGDFSLQQLSAMTARLVETLEEEKENLKIAKGSAAENIGKADRAIQQLSKEWSELGAISKLGIGNSMNKLDESFVRALTDKFTFTAWIEAYGFATELVDSIINLLTILKGNIDKVNAEFKKTAEDIESSINVRCTDESEEEQGHKGMIIKYYDTGKVRRICKGAIQLDSNYTRIRDIRTKIAERLATDKQNFKEAAEKLHCGDIKQQLEQVAMQQVESLFADANQTKNIPQFEQLIGVNIIEKLRNEYNGNDEALKERLHRLVTHAAVMAKENSTEINDGPKIRKSMFVVVPKYDKNQDFLDKLKSTIESLAPAGEEKPKVSEGGSENEIIVMNLEANITPRYLIAVKNLRKEYDNLMSSSKADVAKFETRIEDYEKPLPNLFKPTDAEKREQKDFMVQNALPNVLMAKAMNILTRQEDPETGIEKFVYIPKDEDDLPDYDKMITLGRSLEKSLEKIDQKVADILDKAVNDTLIKDYRHVARQKEMLDAILSDVKQVIEKNGPLSDISKKFNKAYKEIKNKIELLND